MRPEKSAPPRAYAHETQTAFREDEDAAKRLENSDVQASIRARALAYTHAEVTEQQTEKLDRAMRLFCKEVDWRRQLVEKGASPEEINACTDRIEAQQTFIMNSVKEAGELREILLGKIPHDEYRGTGGGTRVSHSGKGAS